MKLIGIYIENFGCLHRYDLKFEDGLTVIREDNGFGKTTLAEFIRAMFYGFPRAAKTLEKNKRKKYLPWNGGKCGGHLTFELDGVRYRIERTFGATPRGDSFQLIDLTTGRKSTRFTENIGVELFGLDGDSFERSTYLPQLREMGPLSTDSIRAKLGDLVEDSNDVGNFDKAAAALRNKRSGFVPYRGSGGAVAEDRAEISRLQQELDRAEGQRDTLDAVQAQMQMLERRIGADNEALAQVREWITAGAQEAANAAVRRQFERLELKYKQAQSAAESRFPDGFPTAEAFEEANRNCEEYLSARARLEELLQEQLKGTKNRGGKMYPVFVLAAVLLGTGAWLAGRFAAGGVLLGAGILTLALGVYLAVRRRQSERKAAEESTRALKLRAEALEKKLYAFLGPYCEDIKPERFHSLLLALQRECDRHAHSREELASLEAQLEAFWTEHREVLGTSGVRLPDLELLKQEERQLVREITENTRRQLELRQRASGLREDIDRIPEIRDELDHWQEKKLSDQRKADTLDRTLEFLQQARDSLSGNYLGAIQRSFGTLLGRMTGEDREKILVTGDLEVLLERQGQTRELSYFSAGQSDLVMLCMRFALVDALFTDVKPFVILDDPFVNLDDAHTEKALALVKELAEDRQILYLTCNSSRI